MTDDTLRSIRVTDPTPPTALPEGRLGIDTVTGSSPTIGLVRTGAELGLSTLPPSLGTAERLSVLGGTATDSGRRSVPDFVSLVFRRQAHPDRPEPAVTVWRPDSSRRTEPSASSRQTADEDGRRGTRSFVPQTPEPRTPDPQDEAGQANRDVPATGEQNSESRDGDWQTDRSPGRRQDSRPPSPESMADQHRPTETRRTAFPTVGGRSLSVLRTGAQDSDEPAQAPTTMRYRQTGPTDRTDRERQPPATDDPAAEPRDGSPDSSHTPGPRQTAEGDGREPATTESGTDTVTSPPEAHSPTEQFVRRVGPERTALSTPLRPGPTSSSATQPVSRPRLTPARSADATEQGDAQTDRKQPVGGRAVRRPGSEEPAQPGQSALARPEDTDTVQPARSVSTRLAESDPTKPTQSAPTRPEETRDRHHLAATEPTMREHISVTGRRPDEAGTTDPSPARRTVPGPTAFTYLSPETPATERTVTRETRRPAGPAALSAALTQAAEPPVSPDSDEPAPPDPPRPDSSPAVETPHQSVSTGRATAASRGRPSERGPRAIPTVVAPFQPGETPATGGPRVTQSRGRPPGRQPLTTRRRPQYGSRAEPNTVSQASAARSPEQREASTRQRASEAAARRVFRSVPASVDDDATPERETARDSPPGESRSSRDSRVADAGTATRAADVAPGGRTTESRRSVAEAPTDEAGPPSVGGSPTADRAPTVQTETPGPRMTVLARLGSGAGADSQPATPAGGASGGLSETVAPSLGGRPGPATPGVVTEPPQVSAPATETGEGPGDLTAGPLLTVARPLRSLRGPGAADAEGTDRPDGTRTHAGDSAGPRLRHSPTPTVSRGTDQTALGRRPVAENRGATESLIQHRSTSRTVRTDEGMPPLTLESTGGRTSTEPRPDPDTTDDGRSTERRQEPSRPAEPSDPGRSRTDNFPKRVTGESTDRRRPGSGSASRARGREQDTGAPPDGRDTSTLYPDLTLKTLAPRVDATRGQESRRDITHSSAERDAGQRRPGADRHAGLDRGGLDERPYPADIDRMAERLYREIERKRRIERERRGL